MMYEHKSYIYIYISRNELVLCSGLNRCIAIGSRQKLYLERHLLLVVGILAVDEFNIPIICLVCTIINGQL